VTVPFLNCEFTWAEITYRWCCARCKAVHSETRRLNRSDPVYMASVPTEWAKVIVDGCEQFLCPKHKIVTMVDGRPLR
jgi:hypothetical protein